jgi:hypothetical protein
MTGYIGFHGQRPIDGWLEPIRLLPSGTPFLSVNDVHMLRDAKSVNPGIFTVFRKFTDDQHLPGLTYDEALRKARLYFDSFIDGTWLQQELWRYVDAVKEWNEYIASSDSETRRQEIITWLKAVTYVWNTEYRFTEKVGGRDIPLVCGSAAIGNDIDPRYARIVYDSNNIMSYHNYTHFFPQESGAHYPKGDRDPLDWRYHSGRWTYMDDEFKKQGIYLRWISTEGSPYNSVSDGWRSNKVLGGDINRYIEECVKYQIDRCHSWNEANNGRYIGSVMFTFGRTGRWDDYELNSGEMTQIAQFVQSYAPEPIDPEPPIDPDQPEPPTEPDEGLPRVDYARTYLVVPQDATLEQWLSIAEVAYEQKNTMGGSNDDSGIGFLSNKTAVLYAIQESKHQEYIDWYATHYPGTKLEFRDYPKA